MLERLSELRKSKKWSLQDTADQLGIAKSTYAGYETGYRWPSLQSLSKIADLFNTSVDYILGRTDDVRSENVIELAEIMKNPDKTISIDGESLSTDEIIEFIAFMRSKRELKSKRLEELLSTFKN
ncbi:helix-turn-helix domain-containing protein [Bacillus cereus group sp. MYBK163-2]|uniref:helix-turn-helix domain-containing protein n=1 Tax=Bacillus cereus group TaxID=86661 RepID=UPI0002EFD0B6|nr:helix-turn-helix transcriptional regulator [Bacillus cereus]